MPTYWWWVALALVVARTAALVCSVKNIGPITGDEPIYEELAASLRAGRGYFAHGVPWVWKPPGWPLTLAALHSLFGPGRSAVVFAQGLFDVGTAFLSAWVARQVMGSRTAAALTFVLVMAWPPFFRESRFMQTEPLFTLTVVACVAAFTRYALAPSFGRALLVGMTAGLASFVRPNGLVVVTGLALGWLICRRGAVRKVAASIVGVALGVLLVLGPWTIRNAVVFHTFIPVSTGGGELLFMGATPETDGRWDHTKWDALKAPVFAAEEARLGHKLSRLEIDRAFFKAGVSIWKNDFFGSIARMFRRVLRLVFVPVDPTDRPALRISFLVVLLVLYALAIPAGVAGLTAADGAAAVAGTMLVGLVFMIFANSVFCTNSRFFEPFRPIVIILAAGTLARMWPRRA